ncbi:iron-sulfur cluster carrier protein ApbC [Coralloluteibacterium thermophilus]|uniref:Iron-sulfur cluster carrier protein n=1 Tax=Coralloluteibacterium thermophilum TaxID=2707049 RepID=A0ABV9NKT8_9GAMM
MTDSLAQAVRTRIGAIVDPHTGQDLAAADAVRGVGVDGDRVAIAIALGYPAAGWHAELAAAAEAAALTVPGVGGATVEVASRVHAHRVRTGLAPLPEVKNIVAVASGKGGVGKSTTAVNLALGLAAEGARVGVLDADIYGPSIPRMLGLAGRPESPDGKTIVPARAHGLQAMSIGLLIEEETPMIWRGPMVTQALDQLLNSTRWEDLDYLVVDLPPGTGDIHLSLSQKVPVSGAVVVTTPQDIATLDARKALKMFEKVEVPVLGIVENMGVHVCSNCGHAEHVFGAGGGEWMAKEYGVPLLGALPLDIRIRTQGDAGTPIVAAEPDTDLARRYRAIARTTAARLSLQAKNRRVGFPNIVVKE